MPARRHRDSDDFSATGHLAAPEVILANISGGDRENLENVLEGTHWAVVDAESPEIENIVRESASPIVICDGDQPDCWRTTIPSLKMRRLRYAHAPFDRNQVLPMLTFANTDCRGHGPFLFRRARARIRFPKNNSPVAPTAIR